MKKKKTKAAKKKKHQSAVISFRVAGVSKEVFDREVQQIIDTLQIIKKFTLSDYMAIITSNRRETLKRILDGDIPIADDPK